MKNNKLRSEIIELRAKFLRNGQLMEARTLLHLLNNKRVSLGLSDENWIVETALEKIGCPIFRRSQNVEKAVFQVCTGLQSCRSRNWKRQGTTVFVTATICLRSIFRSWSPWVWKAVKVGTHSVDIIVYTKYLCRRWKKYIRAAVFKIATDLKFLTCRNFRCVKAI